MNPSIKLIKQGFADGPMFFTVTFHSSEFESLTEAIKTIGTYNGFKPDKVLKALTSAKNLIYDVRLGREYSPVLYIRIARYSQAKYLPVLIRLMRASHPNEVSLDGRTIRLWWD